MRRNRTTGITYWKASWGLKVIIITHWVILHSLHGDVWNKRCSQALVCMLCNPLPFGVMLYNSTPLPLFWSMILRWYPYNQSFAYHMPTIHLNSILLLGCSTSLFWCEHFKSILLCHIHWSLHKSKTNFQRECYTETISAVTLPSSENYRLWG